MTDAAGASRLAELRAQIDAIDESVHRLLMQRANVIDELIEVKGTARNGAAFRPGREAAMMRRLAARHQGHLPLVAIEHLWREIISTFTALQAPFDVVVSLGGETLAAVDAARFYFGLSVPLTGVADADAAVDALEGGGDRLGVILLAEEGGAWWRRLDEARIVARLPFFETERREAGAPALVIAPPLADPTPFEIECFAVDGAREPFGDQSRLSILARGRNGEAASLLVATSDGRGAVEAAFPGGLDIRAVGGYAAPLRVDERG